MGFFSPAIAVSVFLPALLLASASRAAEPGGPLATLVAFQETLSPAVAARLETTPKHYRQIEPSLYYLAALHGELLTGLPQEAQLIIYP